jgi:uncharacterized protein YbjT (DUF2867 family)
MRIAVVGGTGVAGRVAVEETVRRGHEVRVIGRHAPADGGHEFAEADVVAGDGVADALKGVDAVIDASNIISWNEGRATAFFTAGTRNLVAAGAAAGVRRHVVLSIVGIDRVPLGYYRAKLAQEAEARRGRVPVSVVRATQFHEFVGQFLQRTRLGPLALVPAMPEQPVSTADVAVALVDVADGTVIGDVQIGGPERRLAPDLARRLLRARGERALVVPVPLPGNYGRTLRAGGLWLADDAPGRRVGSETFEAWLARTTQP